MNIIRRVLVKYNDREDHLERLNALVDEGEEWKIGRDGEKLEHVYLVLVKSTKAGKKNG